MTDKPSVDHTVGYHSHFFLLLLYDWKHRARLKRTTTVMQYGSQAIFLGSAPKSWTGSMHYIQLRLEII